MRRVTVFLLILFLLSGQLLAQTDLLNARIDRLEVRNSGDGLTVSYKVSGSFTRDIIEKIQIGIETAFEHVIKIYKKIPVFPAGRTVAKKVVVTSVKYDTLTKQYSLSRKVDGLTVETSVTDRLDDVEKWMSEISNFKMGTIDALRGKRNYFLKVRTSLAPNFLLFFIPYDYSASKEKELKF